MQSRAWRERRHASRNIAAVAGVFAFGAVLGGALGIAFAPRPAAPHRASYEGRTAVAAATSAVNPEDADLDSGYLSTGAIDAVKFLPAPPVDGPIAEANRQVFAATRALKGSPRWALAQNDVDQSVVATMRDFSCAVGVTLTPSAAPLTYGLLQRFFKDQTPFLEPAKAIFKRPRPFLAGKGDICVPRSDELVRSPEYPSGHATWGWAVALILGEAVPARANEILARGRAYGESRVVCGLHTPSAIEGGEVLGAALVSAAHSSSSFRNDVRTATAELAGVRQLGPAPDPGQCAAEAALVAKAGY